MPPKQILPLTGEKKREETAVIIVLCMLQKDLEVRAFISNFDLTVEDTSLDNAKLKKALFYFALFSLISISDLWSKIGGI